MGQREQCIVFEVTYETSNLSEYGWAKWNFWSVNILGITRVINETCIYSKSADFIQSNALNIIGFYAHHFNRILVETPHYYELCVRGFDGDTKRRFQYGSSIHVEHGTEVDTWHIILRKTFDG